MSSVDRLVPPRTGIERTLQCTAKRGGRREKIGIAVVCMDDDELAAQCLHLVVVPLRIVLGGFLDGAQRPLHFAEVITTADYAVFEVRDR